MTASTPQLLLGDCLDLMRDMTDNSVDLVFTSPPYEAARTYGIGFKLAGQDWVDWCVARYLECVRICRGLVAWVVEGRTKNYRWSASPAMLMADLHRAGVKLRKPPIFQRVGIPGSGGPDWLRNDYEFIVCSTKGKLPWSNNLAMGRVPKYAPGGEMSYRAVNGRRKNDRDGFGFAGSGARGRKTDGTHKKRRTIFREDTNVRVKGAHDRDICKIANPGNIIRCKVGGGHMGHAIAHENEAPFPESLVRPFILSFCPSDGVVLDCFGGSGTTAAVALKTGRRAISIDIRESEIEKTRRRLAHTQLELLK